MRNGSPFFDNHKQSQMHIATFASSGLDTRTCILAVLAEVMAERQRAPDFLTVHYSANHDAALLRDAVLDFCKGRAFMGSSSCCGVMTEKSLLIGDEGGIAAFAIWNDEGDCGSASAPLGKDPAADAARLAQSALERAGRPGEMPDLVWISAAPGQEEQVLKGLREAFGERALIVGGSSADNDGSGAWSQFGPDSVHGFGLAVSVIFSRGMVSSIYHSGYVETAEQGRITRAEGRRLYEIDDRPAAQVYSEWTGLKLPELDGRDSVSILAEATFFPIGHKAGTIASLPFYLLAHPAAVRADGSLDLFAAVAEGKEIHCMQGTPASLTQRAGRMSGLVSSSLSLQNVSMVGSLIVYCGGCMLGIRDNMEEVRQNILSQMDGQPFLCVFSFGEQGNVHGKGTQHGNLMISCVGFSDRN